MELQNEVPYEYRLSTHQAVFLAAYDIHCQQNACTCSCLDPETWIARQGEFWTDVTGWGRRQMWRDYLISLGDVNRVDDPIPHWK